MAVLLVVGVSRMHGQSALDGFDPNANFFVRVVATQPDGKILVGGDFSSLSPNGGAANVRNYLARLNVDGTLDYFDTGVNGSVTVIVVQPDGKILIGGGFTTVVPYGGPPVTRNRIARLNEDGTLDTAFNPNANGVVTAIALQKDGKILVGGEFNGANSIGGQARNRIARLDPVTGAADAFDPNASGGFTPAIHAIALQRDGKILVGGEFTSIGGQARNYLARFDPVSGAVDSFSPIASPILGGVVRAITVQPDGKILVGGVFTTIGGQPRSCIARLDPSTGAADAFNPNAENAVRTIALQSDGRVLIGGDFGSVGGVTTFMARLHPVTGVPEAFNPGANDRVFSIVLQADGKILAGGVFTSMGGLTRNRIVRLEPDGTLDRTLNNLSMVGSVLAIAVQLDGKILIGGNFTQILGVTRTNLARLNRDGTLDLAFNPLPNGAVRSIAMQTDGKILVGGFFSTIGGQFRNYMARLEASNGAADTFNPNANGWVHSIMVQPDGKILTVGDFTSIGGATRTNLARLDGATGLADAFNPSVGGGGAFTPHVYAAVGQPDGKILVGGSFTSCGGQARTNLARVDGTTGLADTFNANPSRDVYSIAVQSDGHILLTGDFLFVNGQPRDYMARIDAAGLVDPFNPTPGGYIDSVVLQADGKIFVGGEFEFFNQQERDYIIRLQPDGANDLSYYLNANNEVFAIAQQPDGKILLGGSFGNINGEPRLRFARLANETAALQSLAVSQSTITWTRGGASPQFTRVTFESSTDNLNYTPLGNGMVVSNQWSRTGLNLVTGQNLYIRARGHYSGGLNRGSESFQELVQNVYLHPQPRLNIQRSANTNVVLSWATNFTGYTLEANTNLNANVWSMVSPSPTVSGTNYVVTNAVSAPTRFYRLRL